ncbi:MAG TPA: S41 family peptidase, partial [Gemmataceae bacterium]|nr:S41 family peptidase [Gemmataceae bacterium]
RLESNGIGPSGQPAANPAGPLRVLTVSPGSPGQKVGLRPGDLIVGLDRKPPQSPGFTAAFQRLRPLQAGTIPAASLPPVGLTVRRSGRPEPFETSLELTEYHTESVFGVRRKVDGSWDYMLDPAARIGYVRLGGIRNWSAVEFRDALFSLRSSGVRGLLLDLRWCPGGMLDEAIVIVRLFLPDELPRSKPVFWQCDKAGGRIPTSKPLVGQLLEGSVTDLPVLVLINSETSGGGELIAAALQDHGRAVVAGQRTVGKASIQKELEMRDRGPEPRIPFKVTMSTFLRANGKNLQRFADSRWSDDWGVRPDDGRELPLTPEAGRRFKEWWTLQILRPPTDTEALPLDDPENDPQRLAAVHMLQEMMNQ